MSLVKDPADYCVSPGTRGVAGTNYLLEPLQSATDPDPGDTFAYLTGRLKPHDTEAAADSDQAADEASEHGVTSETSAVTNERVYSSLSIGNVTAPDPVQNMFTFLKGSGNKRTEEDQTSSEFLSSRYQTGGCIQTPSPSRERRPFNQEYSPVSAREIGFSKVDDHMRDAADQYKDERSLDSNRGLHEVHNLHHMPCSCNTCRPRRLPEPEDPYHRHMSPTDYNPRRRTPRLNPNFRSTSLHDRSQTPSPDHHFGRPRHFASTYNYYGRNQERRVYSRSPSPDSSESIPRRRLPTYAKAIHAVACFNNSLPRNMPMVEHSPTMPIPRTRIGGPNLGIELQFALPRVCPSPTMHPNRIHSATSTAFRPSAATIPSDNIILESDLEYDSPYGRPFWTHIGGHSQPLSRGRMNLAGNKPHILPSPGRPRFMEPNGNVRRSFVSPVRHGVPVQSSYEPLVRPHGMGPFRRNQIDSTSATMMGAPNRLPGASYYASAFTTMTYRHGTLAPKYQTSLLRNAHPNRFIQASNRIPLHTVMTINECIERPRMQFRGQGAYVGAPYEHWF